MMGVGSSHRLELEFHSAVQRGDTDAVQTLIKEGIDVNYLNEQGQSALQVAVDKGDANTTLILLESGCNVNICQKQGTVLHQVCASNNITMLDLLCCYSPDFYKKDNNGDTPLLTATKAGNMALATALLNSKQRHDVEFSPQSTESEEIQRTVHDSSSDYQRSFVNVPDLQGRSPLHYAAFHGSLETVSILVKYIADVNCQDNDHVTPLHLACRYGHVDVVRSLLSNGAETSLRISDNASKEKGYYPLHTAVKHGFHNIVRILCEAGCDVNVVNSLGRTPLSLACQYGYKDIAITLLSSKANPDIADEMGQFPMLYTLCVGTEKTVDNCRKKENPQFKVDVNSNYLTESEKLVQKCAILESLINFGADINKLDNQKRSACYYAFLHCETPLLAILIKHGAKIIAPNDSWAFHNIQHSQNMILLSNIHFDLRKRAKEVLNNNHDILVSREISRDSSNFPSLQFTCRHVIRQVLSRHTRTSIVPHIQQLPLPSVLKHYLTLSDVFDSMGINFVHS